MELTDLTISQIQQGFAKKQFSALDLTKAYLDRIGKRNKKILAILTLCEKSALLKAKEIDDLLLQGNSVPPLAGVPCVIKDNILVKGVKCTAGSKILENYIASYDASVVKLLKKQGAVILGKGNLDEFAIGSSGEHSAFGKTLNPCDLTRVPGGSSSGPAAAVADNLCAFALGSDTGGSIRLPASFCGVTGFKPTYGAVSRFGLMAMASSLDQIGPITKTSSDAEIVFRAISEKDPCDSTSLGIDKENIPSLKNLCFGVPKEYFIKGIDKSVEKAIRKAIKKLEEKGAKIKEISLPNTEYALAVYYIIMTSEVSANLARYDGVKYGYFKKEKILINDYLGTRGSGFGEEVRRRIMLGTYALSAGYYDAYYLKAQKVRTLIRRDFEQAFQKVDMILTPVSPTLPFKIGEKIDDPLSMYLSDIFTVPLNLAGLPGISIPIGKEKGLPIGLQIIGKGFSDYKLLKAAQIAEKIWM